MMKEFLRKVTVFFGILLGAQLLFFSFNRIYGPTLIEVDEHMIFMGNSMVRRSMNPDFFEDSKNLGSDGELYFNTYHKLKYLFNQFDHIDTVVVGFAYLELSENVDRRFLYQEKSGRYIKNSMVYMSPMAFHNETQASKKMIAANIYESEFLYPKFKDPVFVNGFGKKKGTVEPKRLKAALDENFYTENQVSDFALTNLKYLQKIVELCLEKNKTLVLISVPQHPDYLARVPEKFSKYHTELSKEFNEKGILLINMIDLFSDDKYFVDHVHVSYAGSLEISKRVKSVFEGHEKSTETAN